jgi:hypothetical protein
MAGKAVVRKAVEALPYVSRTWFEWTGDKAGGMLKTLVVEVTFDTDPNMSGYRPGAIEEIEMTVTDALTEQTTMVVSHLRVVPRLG